MPAATSAALLKITGRAFEGYYPGRTHPTLVAAALIDTQGDGTAPPKRQSPGSNPEPKRVTVVAPDFKIPRPLPKLPPLMANTPKIMSTSLYPAGSSPFYSDACTPESKACTPESKACTPESKACTPGSESPTMNLSFLPQEDITPVASPEPEDLSLAGIAQRAECISDIPEDVMINAVWIDGNNLHVHLRRDSEDYTRTFESHPKLNMFHNSATNDNEQRAARMICILPCALPEGWREIYRTASSSGYEIITLLSKKRTVFVCHRKTHQY